MKPAHLPAHKKKHQGRFERADGGTLFLDELATAPMQVQEKLLRVIEYGHLERVGGSQPLQVDVRLICATNDNLPAMAAKGKFRADLLDRLAFDVVQIPPLRQRQQDIMLLAQHFAIQMCRELDLPLFPGFTEQAKQRLQNYYWPGNIRELKNVVERSVYRHGENFDQLDNIIINPFVSAPHSIVNVDNSNDSSLPPLPSLPVNLKQWQHDSERQLIELSLKANRFNQRKAAEKLGLTYHQLRGLIKKHNISTNDK